MDGVRPSLGARARQFAESATASYLVLGVPWLIIRDANGWNSEREFRGFEFLSLFISVGLFVPCSLLSSMLLFGLLGPEAGFGKPFRAWAAGIVAVLLLTSERSWEFCSFGNAGRNSDIAPLVGIGLLMVFGAHLFVWALPPWCRERQSRQGAN